MIFLKSKGIGLPCTGSISLLSKVQLAWHLKEIRSGGKKERMREREKERKRQKGRKGGRKEESGLRKVGDRNRGERV